MRAYCERCGREVEGAYEHPTLRRFAWGYLLIWVPFVPILPIMGADFMVSLPILMVYMLGIGPVLGIIRERPRCVACGANVTPLKKSG